ncbi:secreted RxLR effector protein 161-like [Gossypium arboreum]|uniref:secreted RxLR effector protein 161-like n=1 Tax=Gossypium arboreum TaxID=29729 RepID=UPI0022F18A31|nr:secreted RxLR effector protein 161-like [Gossypium arboreum]
MQNCKATNTLVAVGEKLSSQGDFEKVSESTYRSLVGCLFNLIATRSDIMYVVSPLSRFMHCCNINHFQVAKRVLRYIKGTLNFGVMFTRVERMKLLGFAENYWAGSIDNMKSTSGHLFTLRSTVFFWSSKKQSIATQSTVKAKYVADLGVIN